MDLFFTQGYNLTTTPTRVVESAGVNRVVRIIEREYESWIGFGDYTADWTKRFGAQPEFVLPAGIELWASSYGGGPNNGESRIEIMVTSIGR